MIIATSAAAVLAMAGFGVYVTHLVAEDHKKQSEKQKIDDYFRELKDIDTYVTNIMTTRQIAAGPNQLTARLAELGGERFNIVIESTYEAMIALRKAGASNDEVIANTRGEIIKYAEEILGKTDADEYLKTTRFFKP